MSPAMHYLKCAFCFLAGTRRRGGHQGSHPEQGWGDGQIPNAKETNWQPWTKERRGETGSALPSPSAWCARWSQSVSTSSDCLLTPQGCEQARLFTVWWLRGWIHSLAGCRKFRGPACWGCNRKVARETYWLPESLQTTGGGGFQFTVQKGIPAQGLGTCPFWGLLGMFAGIFPFD